MTNNINDLPARGEMMLKTKEQFERMAELFEKALLKEKEENSRLREKINGLEQKLASRNGKCNELNETISSLNKSEARK
jgi:cell division septum initiation protein DivIVA